MKKVHNKLIILDFDHTIINTSLLTEAIAEELQKGFGIGKNEYKKAREKVKKCCVVEDIDKVIAELPNENKKALHDTFHRVIKEQVKEFVFSDVQNFLKKHRDEFDIVVVTHGNKELQSEKIKHSGLPEYVENRIDIKDKSWVVSSLENGYEEIYFIDDKAQNIEDVKNKHPEVITYFLKRPEDCKYCSVNSDSNFIDKVVENLDFEIK